MKLKELGLGIDVGSVTVKIAVIDAENKVLYKAYKKHHSDPITTVLKVLGEYSETLESKHKQYRIAVTGSGRKFFEQGLGLLSVNEIIAQATAAGRLYPGVKSIIEIGGQDSKYIRLKTSENSKEIQIATQKMNDICAAGTGAFIEQQAERMNIEVEDFGDEALKATTPAFIAGRCSVFSKSDIVHLQQEGVSKANIAMGICNAVVRNYMAQFLKGRKIETPVVFQGGLAANKGVVRAFINQLKVSDSKLYIAKDYEVMGAIGCALVVREVNNQPLQTLEQLCANLKGLKKDRENKKNQSHSRQLTRPSVGISTITEVKNTVGPVYMGIDVGSTSTCIAVVNGDGALVAKQYLLNEGDLLQSVKACLQRLKTDSDYGGKIAGAGVTGSGRALVAKYVGADLVKDEITAQIKAALHMWPQVDTIIEIGGQDSKYITLNEGNVLNFEMNKVCAAGTGYFLQEQAKRLGEDIGTLAELAFQGKAPCDLGSRCTVFMESDIINHQQMGAPKADIAAGLSYAVARNYVEKVIGGRSVGQNILFLGGTAHNASVVSAFENVLEKQITVPKHHEVSAAIGVALLTKDYFASNTEQATVFRGIEKCSENYTLSFFECKSCQNLCKIGNVQLDETTQIFYGGACGKYEGEKASFNGPDLFKLRQELLLSYVENQDSSLEQTIGIPRVHLFYELLPLYSAFLNGLGYRVVLSDESQGEVVKDALERTAIDNCFASKMVYGHVKNLINKGVERIFIPTVVEFQRKVKDLDRNHNCPHIQGMADLIRIAYPDTEIWSPIITREKSDKDWKTELCQFALENGVSKQKAEVAINRAEQIQNDFVAKCESLFETHRTRIAKGQKVAVVFGKPYNVNDEKLNLNIARKLMDMNIVPVPYDCLPLSKQVLPSNFRDMVWNSGQDLIRAAKCCISDPNMFPVLITNFGCGPDSFVIKFMEELYSERSLLVLEVDEHASDVGFITRLEAFFNTVSGGAQSHFDRVLPRFRPFQPSKTHRQKDRMIYVPWGFDSYQAISAAFRSVGYPSKMLPKHDEITEKYARMHSSGRECLPYIMHVGDAVRMTQDEAFDPKKSALYMPASDLACRVSLFSTSIQFLLDSLGCKDVPVIAPRLSMDSDEVVAQFGIKFAQNVFRGMLAIETVSRKVSQIRPYEINSNDTDAVYERGVDQICEAIATGKDLFKALEEIVKNFENISVDLSQKRPLIGLIGDDYTRGNDYANGQIVKQIESMGGQAVTVPIWSTFFEYQMGNKPERTLKRKKYLEYGVDKFKQYLGHKDIEAFNRVFKGLIPCYPDPGYAKMVEIAGKYIDERSEPLTIMALTHAIRLLEMGVDGIVNLVGFQCMIHSIVSGVLQTVYKDYQDTPTLTLCYDFQEKVHHINRLEAFMHQAKQKADQNDSRDFLTVNKGKSAIG